MNRGWMMPTEPIKPFDTRPDRSRPWVVFHGTVMTEHSPVTFQRFKTKSDAVLYAKQVATINPGENALVLRIESSMLSIGVVCTYDREDPDDVF